MFYFQDHNIGCEYDPISLDITAFIRVSVWIALWINPFICQGRRFQDQNLLDNPPKHRLNQYSHYGRKAFLRDATTLCTDGEMSGDNAEIVNSISQFRKGLKTSLFSIHFDYLLPSFISIIPNTACIDSSFIAFIIWAGFVTQIWGLWPFV